MKNAFERPGTVIEADVERGRLPGAVARAQFLVPVEHRVGGLVFPPDRERRFGEFGQVLGERIRSCRRPSSTTIVRPTDTSGLVIE